MSSPPGWYPDPSAPSTERWWDGAAWTEHRRTAQAPQPSQPSTVPIGFGPVVPVAGGSGGRGRGKTVALVVAALVVVAAIVIGVIVLAGSDDTKAGPTDASSPATTDTTPSPSDSPTPSPSPSASTDASVVVDDLDGITLPVLGGWGKAEYVVDDTILLTTPGTYDCPGDGDLCHHGTVASSSVTSTNQTDPKAVAKADISEAARHAFGKDALDNEPYGGITSHQKIKEGSIAVAGRAGYLVRWRVKTGAGSGGYIESLVFPSSTGSESLVCVRFAFDAGSDGPPLSDMDKITKGIHSLGDAASGGGVGTGVGPSQ